ncbi:MAG: J domain-containing protein [Bryobacterales bacterium]|nr:J domain-containing protein [Bryobacterales bacterium]
MVRLARAGYEFTLPALATMMEPPKAACEASPASADEDLYALLGLSPEADVAAVRHAWRRLAARYHPDASQRGGTPLDDHARTEEFLRVQDAYAVLSHPERRKQYDEARRDRDFAGDEQSAAPAYSGSRTAWTVTMASGSDWARRWVSLLPVAAVFRVRYLALAVALGALVVMWETAGAGKRSDLWGGRANSTAEWQAFASAVDHAVERANAAGTVSRPMGRATQLPESKAAQSEHSPTRTSPGASSTAKRHSTSTGTGMSVSAGTFTHASSRDREALDSDASSGLAAPGAPRREELGERDSESPGTAAQSLPALSHAAPLASRHELSHDTWQQGWQGEWLAGCMIPRTGVVSNGIFKVQGREARLQWQSWDEEPARAQESIVMFVSPDSVRPDGASPEARLLLFHPTDSNGPLGFLSKEDATAGRLRLEEATAGQVPCREWRLASMRGGALTGRWILPDKRTNTEDLFPLQYMEIMIDEKPEGIAGRLTSRYTLRNSHPAAASLAGAGFQSALEFRFGSPANGFNGIFQWSNGSHGEGTLQLAPLSPRAMAIRWKVHRLVPGRVQLTGGTATVRRRQP